MPTEEIQLDQLIIHRVGNKARQEQLQISNSIIECADNLKKLLIDGFLKSVHSDKKKYQFIHPESLKQNTIYAIARNFFDQKIDFILASHQIVQFLFEQGNHPAILAGDVFVVLFDNVLLENEPHQAIGIFKAEVPDEFLTVISSSEDFDVQYAQGINPKSIDKAALILDHGPTLFAADKLSHQSKFWFEDFLQAIQVPGNNQRIQVTASAVEDIVNAIDTEQEKIEFKKEIEVLCQEKDEICASDIQTTASKYMPPAKVQEQFTKVVEDKGIAWDAEQTLPSKSVWKKLEKSWSKVGVGHGISMLLPSDLELELVETDAESEDELVITLRLRRR